MYIIAKLILHHFLPPGLKMPMLVWYGYDTSHIFRGKNLWFGIFRGQQIKLGLFCPKYFHYLYLWACLILAAKIHPVLSFVLKPLLVLTNLCGLQAIHSFRHSIDYHFANKRKYHLNTHAHKSQYTSIESNALTFSKAIVHVYMHCIPCRLSLFIGGKPEMG